MRVNTKVHEVDRRPGHAGPASQDHGRCVPGPETDRRGQIRRAVARRERLFARRGQKVYSTLVEIDNGSPDFRPGMTARVDILVAERDNVLSVPVKAVLLFDGKDHVAVKKPDGGFDWREVDLGLSDEKIVEIKAGPQERRRRGTRTARPDERGGETPESSVRRPGPPSLPARKNAPR